MACSYAKKGAPCQDITEVARRNTKADFPIAAGKKPGDATATGSDYCSLFFHINDDSISSIMLNVHIEYDYNILNTEYM